ncbi:MAG: T9SS type A sorting domain-containing protein, partial [Candidatus Cloacimonetes bacterium]|nr:T9SS type A sorting domain-containing protein [Candidatus Cloacimonadota bacterium]MCK9242913.1 T9SS type A sorting domain-containing protein [Candidatus Cloacimonadota bacterium]
LMLTICFFMSCNLFARNIYVDGDQAAYGNGTISTPYKSIVSAISEARNHAEPNTIHIKGRDSANYYDQNLSISGFQYPLTLKQWDISSNELIIKGTGNSMSTITLGNNAATIKIMGATISRASEPQINSTLLGGGLFIYYSESVVIEDCIINHCRAWKGGGIYAYQSDLELINTKMHNNTGVRYTGLVLISFGGAIYAEDSEITVSESLLYFNHGGSQTACEETIYLYGGLLSCEATTLYHDSPTAVQVWTYEGDSVFQNCIIFQPYMNVNASYEFCCAYNTQYSAFGGLGNIIADPMFNGDFSLEKGSPCIGTGYSADFWDHQGAPGNQDLITPHDETQDIGGIPYNGDRFIRYSFDDDPQGNWMCFPVLDDHSYVNIDGVDYRADNMRAFFYDYEGPFSEMDRVSFKWYDPGNVFGEYTHRPNAVITWHYMRGLNSDEGFLGYKALFNSPLEMERLHGYHVPLDQYVQVPEPGVENWIGYFLPETQTVSAFGSYLDELYYIQHKDWTMVRIMAKRGAPWIVFGEVGAPSPSLSYGDMVIVKRFGSPSVGQFQWARGLHATKYVRETPEYFEFNIEPDYTAVFVQMDSLATTKEIAIMSDDLCYGAAVVNGETVMIPAFISSLPEGSELELVAWDGAKSSAKSISINLFDQTNNAYVQCSSFVKDTSDHYLIKMGSTLPDTDAPSTLSLGIKNYPNPFNPSTTISYSVPANGDVMLNIYNAKGQLVNTLVSEHKNKGNYQVVWQGRDMSGNSVASGLYFTRLVSGGKSINNKMLLLK